MWGKFSRHWSIVTILARFLKRNRDRYIGGTLEVYDPFGIFRGSITSLDLEDGVLKLAVDVLVLQLVRHGDVVTYNLIHPKPTMVEMHRCSIAIQDGAIFTIEMIRDEKLWPMMFRDEKLRLIPKDRLNTPLLAA